MSNFHQLEVVGRGSDTQLRVSENLNCICYIYLVPQGLLVLTFFDPWWRLVLDPCLAPEEWY